MFKKIIPIIPIALSIFVVILVLSCAVFVKPEPNVPVQPVAENIVNNDVVSPATIPTTTSTSLPFVEDDDIPELDTSDWKVYRNEEYGFEIKYPKDWEYRMQEGGMGIHHGIDFIDFKNQDIHIFLDLGAPIYSIEDVNKYAQEDFKIRDFKIELDEYIIIDGIKGVKYISSYDNLINKKYVAAYWPDKSTIREDDFCILETYIKPENKNSETAIINIFDQILSTIKFNNH